VTKLPPGVKSSPKVHVPDLKTLKKQLLQALLNISHFSLLASCVT